MADAIRVICFRILLQAQDEDGTHMNDRQLRDETITLFLAGHETTANTLSWTWWLLAQNPAVEKKFHEELDGVLGGRVPTLDDLPKLHLSESCADRIAAAVSHGLGHGAAGGRRARNCGLSGTRRVRRGVCAMGGTPRRALVRRAAGVSSGALGKRPGEAAAAIRVLSVWRRTASVHRQHLRADGSERGAGDDRAEVPVCLGPDTRSLRWRRSRCDLATEFGCVWRRVPSVRCLQIYLGPRPRPRGVLGKGLAHFAPVTADSNELSLITSEPLRSQRWLRPLLRPWVGGAAMPTDRQPAGPQSRNSGLSPSAASDRFKRIIRHTCVLEKAGAEGRKELLCWKKIRAAGTRSFCGKMRIALYRFRGRRESKIGQEKNGRWQDSNRHFGVAL